MLISWTLNLQPNTVTWKELEGTYDDVTLHTELTCIAANRGVSMSKESVVTWDRESEFSELFWTDVIEISSLTLPLASKPSAFASTMSPPPLRLFQIPFCVGVFLSFVLSLISFFLLSSPPCRGLELLTAPRCMGVSSPSSVMDVSISAESVETAWPAWIGMSSVKENTLKLSLEYFYYGIEFWKMLFCTSICEVLLHSKTI